MRKIESVLTPKEIEEIKDEVKFRTKVLVELKALHNIPIKVGKLETFTTIHSTLLIGIAIAILIMFLNGCAAYFGDDFMIATPFTEAKSGDKSINAKIIPTDIILK